MPTAYPPSFYDPVYAVQPPGGPGATALAPAELARTVNKDLITRRHPEWIEFNLHDRWLLDSLEGGQRYSQAIYGFDWRGQPVRNLVRHKREYPEARDKGAVGPYLNAPVGADPLMPATDDDYEHRRSRTPVPTFLPEAVDHYIGHIMAQKVKRDIPDTSDFDGVRRWLSNVDGTRTGIDDWLTNLLWRILLSVGNVDVQFCHPIPPEDMVINSRFDEIRYNLDGCISRIILSHNMCWWELNPDGSYSKALVQEWTAGGDSDPRYVISQFHPQIQFQQPQSLFRPKQRYRLWLPDRWILYDDAGVKLSEDDHDYGVVPIVRVFCRRRPRCTNMGQSPFEAIAFRQREYYNKDSELILSDTLQAHPLLQGPEDYIQPDGSVPIGPSWLLPKKKNGEGLNASYEGFDTVNFPKDGAESLRQNKLDIVDDVHRDASLAKPAGAAGRGGSTVSQSGISKEIDNDTLHKRLTNVAKLMETAETRMIEMAYRVVNKGRPPEIDADGNVKFSVKYPSVFALHGADQIADGAVQFQAILANSGQCPKAVGMLLSQLFKELIKGHPDEVYEEVDEEIEAALETKAKEHEQSRELMLDAREQSAKALPKPGKDGHGEEEPEGDEIAGEPKEESRKEQEEES